MGREEYLERLRRALAGRMAAEEVERTVAYYAACLDEAGPEGEEARMADWGTPEELGARLLDDLGRKTLSPRGRKLLWGAIAGVLVLSAALWLVRLRPWAAPSGDRGSSDLTEPFTAVDVDLDWGNVTLRQEGDLCRCETDWTGADYTINAWVEKGVLRVEGRQRGGLHLDWSDDHTAQVTITVPEGASLTALEVTTDAGDVVLTGGAEGLSVGPLTVESDMGSVTVEHLTAEESDFTLDLGELTVSDCVLGDTQAENSSGGVTLMDSRAGELFCALDLGDLRLERVTGASADLAADLGNITVKDGTLTGGTVTCDGGEVELSGGLSGVWEVTNSMGSIAFDTTTSGWVYDLEVDLGGITLNGADQGTRAAGGSGSHQLTAYSDLGDVNVTFG